jgi:hypothetical protein
MGLPLGCRAKFAHDDAGIRSRPVSKQRESYFVLGAYGVTQAILR